MREAMYAFMRRRSARSWSRLMDDFTIRLSDVARHAADTVLRTAPGVPVRGCTGDILAQLPEAGLDTMGRLLN
jgi:hypothetical protein